MGIKLSQIRMQKSTGIAPTALLINATFVRWD